MKKLFKKIIAVFAVSAMAMSMPLSVSADELHDNKDADIVSESKYDIAPGLNLTDEDVDELIEKIYAMSEEEGWSEEVTNDMVNIWYKDNTSDVSALSARAASSEPTYYTYPVSDFFAAVSVKSNVKVSNGKGFVFNYSKSDNIKLKDKPICIGNALSLTENQIEIDSNTSSAQCYYSATLKNLSTTTTKCGNIITFRCYIDSPVKSQYSGVRALNILRNNTSINSIGGFNNANLYVTDTNYNNNYIGALGDLNGDYSVNKVDLQMLSSYMIKQEDNISNKPLVFAAADVTEDGCIDICDYSLLSNYVKGNYNSLRIN